MFAICSCNETQKQTTYKLSNNYSKSLDYKLLLSGHSKGYTFERKVQDKIIRWRWRQRRFLPFSRYYVNWNQRTRLSVCFACCRAGMQSVHLSQLVVSLNWGRWFLSLSLSLRIRETTLPGGFLFFPTDSNVASRICLTANHFDYAQPAVLETCTFI